MTAEKIRLCACGLALLASSVGVIPCVTAQGVPDETASEAEPPEEVKVRETRPGFEEPESGSAIKSGALLRELPLSAEVLAGRLIEESQYRGLAGVLDSFSLTIATPGERGLFEEVILRGFAEIPFYRDGLNDSLGSLPVREMANVERIEILKGPNSAIYGPGEPGGSVNLETKKPRLEGQREISAGYGSHERYRFELDATGPVPGVDDFAYRLIGVVEDAGSFRDFVDSGRVFAAPSLRWAPSDDVDVLAAMEYIHYEAPFDSGVVAVDGTFPLPRSRFLGEPRIGPQVIEAFTALLDAGWEINDTWAVSGALYWQRFGIDGPRVEPSELDDIDLSEPSATLVRELVDESVDSEVVTVQLEVEGRFPIGGIENRVLAGYEFSSADDREDLLESDDEDEPWEVDIFDVEYGQPPPEIEPEVRVRESTDLHSIYLQDFIELGDHWRVLAGTRLDIFSAHGRELVEGGRFSQDDEVFSSRVGIVYLHDEFVSVFGSFSESLDPNEGLDPDRNPLKPTRGRAFEVGVKVRHQGLGAALDASLFHIEQTNVTSDAPNDPGFEIQTARQVSAGMDLELSLRPFEWARLGLKYGYTDSEIRDDPEIPDGTAPLNAPFHKFLAAGLLVFSIREEEDLRIGVNYTYLSKRQASLDEEELGVKLPGYATVNLFVDYALTPHVTLGLDATNVFDRNYIAGSQSDLLHLTPGAPATVFGSVSVRF